MANWWEDAPLVEEEKTPAPTGEDNWWAEAPLAEPEVQTPTEPAIAPENVLDDRGVPGGIPKAPLPNEDLGLSRYEDMTPEQAFKDYERLKSDPTNSTSITGDVVKNNQVVPHPEVYLSPTGEEVQADTGIGQMVSNTARGVTKNLVVTGAAMIDQMMGPESSYNLAEKADKAIANRATGSGIQEVLMQAGEAASGFVAGYKVGNKTGSVASGGNYSARNAANAFAKALGSFGSMVGGAMTMNPDTETAAVGDNAMLGDTFKGTIFEGVPVDKNGSFSEQVLAKKTNILLDELTAGFAAQGVVEAGAWAAKAVKYITYDQIKPLWSQGAREEEAASALIQAVTGSMKNTPEDVANLKKVVNENMDVWMKMGSEDEAFQMNRTVLSAAEEGLKETNPVAARRAMEVESALNNTANPNLNTRLDLPVNEFQRFQRDQLELRGGRDGIDYTTNTIADSGIADVNAGRQAEQMQQANVRTAEEETRNVLRNNSFIGDDVKAAEANPTLDVNSYKTNAQTNVMKDMQGAADSIQKKTDELYKNIPDGVPIEEESFIKTMVDAKDFIPSSVKNLIADEGTVLDYKTINTKILPKVNSALRDAQKRGDTRAIESLQDVRNNIIETQSDFVEAAGGDAGKIAAEARSYFRDVELPFRDSNAVGDLFDKRPNKYNAMDNQQAATTKLSDKKMGSSKAVVDLINRPEYQGDKKELLKVYIGDWASDALKKLHTEGGIDKIDPQDIVRSLGDAGVQLKKEFPTEVGELETLATKLRDAKGNASAQQSVLEEVTKTKNEIESSVFGGALRRFIKNKPGGVIQKTQNGYQEFKTLFNNKSAGNEVDEIVTRVRESGDPLAQKGLEGAYLAYLKDRLGETAKGFSSNQAKRLSDEPDLDSLADYGRKIFTDKEEIEDYIGIVKAITREEDKRVPEGLALTSKGVPNFKDRGRVAADRGITFTLGVLNPAATRARNVSRILIDTSKADDAKNKIFDLMTSDRQYFNELMDKLGNSMNNKFGDEAKSVMWKTMVASGIYNYDAEETFNKRWEELKKSDLQAETEEVLKKK